MNTKAEKLTPEQHQADPPSEYSEEVLENSVEGIPDGSKRRFKIPGTRREFYRGGPYTGLTEVDGKQTHNAEAAKRKDPVSHEPVSKRFGHLEVGNRAGKSDDGDEREYSKYRQKEQFDTYLEQKKISKPNKWDSMSIEDRKGWLDENT